MPFCVIKSRTIKFAIVICMVAVMLCISINGSASAQVFFGYPTRRVPVYSVDTQEKKVAISFDAAWGAEKTEKIMEIVKDFNCNATFFLVGFWTDKYGDLVKKLDEQGFEIGTHSMTHPDMTKLSKEDIKTELSNSIDLIQKITNKPVKLFRAPYGAYNNSLIEVCDQLNLIPIQWDVDSLDWKGLSADNITTRIMNKVKNGSIILCHNDAEHIVEALPLVLDRLQKMGYKVTNVGDVVYKENYTIDRNGVQRLNAQ